MDHGIIHLRLYDDLMIRECVLSRAIIKGLPVLAMRGSAWREEDMSVCSIATIFGSLLI
jgi:hypothetical protein